MTILLQQEFESQSQSGANSLERIFQDKPLEAGPVFSIDKLEVANTYCQRFSKKRNGAKCIIVQDRNFLRIWSEVSCLEANASQNDDLSKEEIPINSLPVQPSFVRFCRQLLANEIGPIAELVCKKTLAKRPNLTRTEFVTILAKKISDPTLAERFKQDALR